MKKPSSSSKPSTKRTLAAPLAAAVIGAAAISATAAIEAKEQGASQQTAAMKEIVLPIEGMSCVSCVARVKKEISSMSGVAAVKVDLAERHARISFDSKRISPKDLVAAVDKLGYKAGEPKDAPKQSGK